MREETTTTKSAAPPPAPAVRVRKFGPPDELPAGFGVDTQTDERIQGVVPTDQVRALLDAFGLQERTEIVFPFQHIKRAHGEIWRLRIEAAKHHSVKGEPVYGHQWIYEQQLPERVQGAQ